MVNDRKISYTPLKLVMDKLIALFFLLLFSPVIILTIAGIFLSPIFRPQDRGPLIYRERRYSQGKLFYILKFRVLRKELIDKVQQQNQHARIYEIEIGNLTFVGRYLKKWYLDELPQLINILRGDMSLVGPRPWIEEYYNSQLKRGISYRKHIMAGWTGPGQLCKGKISERDIAQRAEAEDIEYADKCRTAGSLSILIYDLKILFKTLRTMLEGEGILN